MKRILSFKLRSLPNSKNFFEYLDTAIYVFAIIFVFNFVYIMLIADDFNPVFPIGFALLIPVAFAKKYHEIESRNSTITNDDFRELLVDLRQHQWQSFKEKIHDRPEFLKAQYKNRTLLYWCKKYNDLKANKLIIEEIKNNNKAS